MKFEMYDLLVFEDDAGSIYQDCVCAIKERFSDFEIECNKFDVCISKDYSRILRVVGYDTFDKASGCYTGYRDNFKLKEIWTRTDEDTYKRVWQLGTDRSIIDKLVGDSTRTIQTVIDDGSYLESEEGKKKLAEIKKLLYREARNFTFKADFGKPIKEYLTQNNLIQDKESE